MTRVRTLLAGIAGGGLVVSLVGGVAAPASAAYAPDPDDVTTTPTAPRVGDLVGVGSDTTQNAMARLARGYNATPGSASVKLYTYAATAGGSSTSGDVQLADGSVPRPTTSSAGRALLRAATNEPGVAYVRSADVLTAAEVTDANALRMIPFASDTLQMVVPGAAGSAPASLTGTQIASIYRCDAGSRNWSAFGGADQQINPQLPRTGTDVRAEFLRQIRQFNSNTDLSVGPCVEETTSDNDVRPVVATAGSLAPVSAARTKGVTTVRALGGFTPAYAVYNVVRGQDTTKPAFQSVFGSGGYLCSAAAKAQIEAAGLTQLAPVAQGGVCGVATTAVTRNLKAAIPAVTTTLAATVASTTTNGGAPAARVNATVTPARATSGSPTGTLAVFEGSAQVVTGVPVQGGKAVATVPTAPGNHSYRLVYTPADGTPFQGSEITSTGIVRTGSTVRESFSATARMKVRRVNGKKRFLVKPVTGTVTVAPVGITVAATGTITVKKGRKVVATARLVDGRATLRLKRLTRGVNRFVATYSGDTVVASSTLTFKVRSVRKR